MNSLQPPSGCEQERLQLPLVDKLICAVDICLLCLLLDSRLLVDEAELCFGRKVVVRTLSCSKLQTEFK